MFKCSLGPPLAGAVAPQTSTNSHWASVPVLARGLVGAGARDLAGGRTERVWAWGDRLSKASG